MVFRNRNNHWGIAKTAWVTLVNLLTASILIFYLFDVWSDTPILQRAVFQGAQCLVIVGLLVGLAFEFRRSRNAAVWNVTTQLAAAVFPCAVFALIRYNAKNSGTAIDGMEAILVLYGFWIFIASCVTYFLYVRWKQVQPTNDGR